MLWASELQPRIGLLAISFALEVGNWSTGEVVLRVRVSRLG